MLEYPESPESPHKLVLPENVSIIAFYTVIMGEMIPKVANFGQFCGQFLHKFGPVGP